MQPFFSTNTKPTLTVHCTNYTILYPLPCTRHWRTNPGLQIITKKEHQTTDLSFCCFNQSLSRPSAQSITSGCLTQHWHAVDTWKSQRTSTNYDAETLKPESTRTAKNHIKNLKSLRYISIPVAMLQTTDTYSQPYTLQR